MVKEKKAADAFSLDAGVPKIEGELRPQPKFADRISSRVIGVVVALGLVMVGVFFAALDSMDRKKKSPEETAEMEKKKSTSAKAVDTVAPKDLTESPEVPGSVGPASLVGKVPPPQDDLFGELGGRSSLAGGAAMSLGSPGDVPSKGLGKGTSSGAHVDDGLGSGSAAAPAIPPPPTPEQQAELLARQERAKRLGQARNNGLSAKSYAGEDKKLGAAALAVGGIPSLPGGAGGFLSAANAGQPPAKSDSEQDEKLNFLKTGGKDDRERSYLQHTQQPALSQNELKRGSYLPLRLEGDINSGQPGMVRARVTEDVYDTVTSCRLLVPAMTIVQGAYDSKVAIGQTRNLVVWNYMGFEDGSELNLGTMQGYDSKGAAGIEADVDNHYMRLFGLAFGMSMITAGVQQSMPPTPTGTTAQTPQQAMATALAQQYGQLGAQILGKYMQVQPTLRNFAGERFMIMLPSTIVLKKVWRNRCK